MFFFYDFYSGFSNEHTTYNFAVSQWFNIFWELGWPMNIIIQPSVSLIGLILGISFFPSMSISERNGANP